MRVSLKGIEMDIMMDTLGLFLWIFRESNPLLEPKTDEEEPFPMTDDRKNYRMEALAVVLEVMDDEERVKKVGRTTN